MWCWGYGLAGFRLCRLLSAYSEDPPSSSPVVVARRCSSVVLLRLAIRVSLWLRDDVFGVSGLVLAWLLLLVTHHVP